MELIIGYGATAVWMAYNIAGEPFAKEGTGSELLLLKDGTVGFWEREGECGRIAESLDDF